MNYLICPSCGLPFIAAFANCFEGNVIECTHCKKGAIFIFIGRIVQGDRVITAGQKYLAVAGIKRKGKV